MLQPREGIAGTQRDALLSLEDDAQPARQAIRDLTMRVYETVLVGNPAPVHTEIFQRMSKPKVGDLVLEVSRRGRHADYRGLGYLLDDRVEWQHTDAEWAEVADDWDWDGERPTEEATYVQYGPAPVDVCRWVNSMFVTVPL